MNKVCIIIDDKDQAQFIEDIVKRTKRNGIELSCIQFNPANHTKEVVKEGKVDYVIDIDAVKAKLAEPTYLGQRVDLIACDYNFEDESFNGFSISLYIRSTHKSLPILFYSAQGELVAGKLQTVEDVKSLIAAKFADFVLRGQYPDKVVHMLINSYSVEQEFLKFLEDFGMLTLENAYPPLEGRTLSYISNEVKKGTDIGEGFLKEMIELTFSNILKVSHE